VQDLGDLAGDCPEDLGRRRVPRDERPHPSQGSLLFGRTGGRRQAGAAGEVS
jgi:hypothetical protein